jgi:hypothetical protein
MPNDFTIADVLIPLLGGAAAAYSPRYLGQGVQAGAGLYGVMQNQKRYSREEAAQLQHYKNIESQAQIHDALAKQTGDETITARKKLAEAFAAQYGQTDPNMSLPLDEKTGSIANALEAGGLTWDEATKQMQPPPPPKPIAPEEPYGTGTGGIYNKQTGKWSVPPPTKTPAGPKPTNVEAQIVQLNREIRQIGEALKFADPDEEGELQAQLEDAKATRDQLKSQRLAPAGEGANPNATTVEVNIPGVHTEAGRKLASKYHLGS